MKGLHRSYHSRVRMSPKNNYFNLNYLINKLIKKITKNSMQIASEMKKMATK